MRELEIESSVSKMAVGSPSTVDSRVLYTIRSLEREGFVDVAVSALAARVNLSSSRLQHLFKAELSMSIRDYVRARRLERAAYLISSTQYRISEIFYSVGFNDASNFTHAFKRHFGMTPCAYRDAAIRRARDAHARRDSVSDNGDGTAS
ncbi:MAG: helix-turn-helix domain-containing protein [Thermoanaerobaculia bacterium]